MSKETGKQANISPSNDIPGLPSYMNCSLKGPIHLQLLIYIFAFGADILGLHGPSCPRPVCGLTPHKWSYGNMLNFEGGGWLKLHFPLRKSYGVYYLDLELHRP